MSYTFDKGRAGEFLMCSLLRGLTTHACSVLTGVGRMSSCG